MRVARSPSLVALLLGTLAVSQAAVAQECQCTGVPQGKPFSEEGGDGQPLNWKFLPYLVSPATLQQPILVCYFKQVENKSGEEVRDVNWQVAKFFRSIIPKQKLTTSCPMIPGELKLAPTNGLLQYVGPGNGDYDTTVFQPKGGWGDTASTANPPGPGFEKNATRTELTFFVENTKGVAVPARLTLQSTASMHSDKASITYSVANDSATPLYVRVNLSASELIVREIPLI